MSEKLQMMNKIPQMGVVQIFMVFGCQFLVTIGFLVVAIIYAFTIETEWECEPWGETACGATENSDAGQNSCWGYQEESMLTDLNVMDYYPDNMQGFYEDNFNYVSKEFNMVLIIFFVTSLIGFIQIILVILVAVTKSDLVNKINQCLNIAGCLGFANLIMMMVFRLRYSGKYCSGDWSVWEDAYGGDYDLAKAARSARIDLDIGLSRRGDALFILIIAIWVLPLVACCLMCCIMAFVLKSMM